nr:MICAL-like protein 1 isoform X2 [Aedes albopictus]XP_029718715.1 MICAL-like protein 1 isoform X2 [Aedes albopictus]XP_029718716.1 MICAL-like protein 1 isoform X2 [Aedes albopictus]XP_029718717.1 MICAL-like protein 1 isoform X2 [Aedes albopictus]XP_029718718.1 MICAL-like protein 1 isoform X2 [Aedes albopictus]
MSERRGTKALELWCRRVTEGYKDVRVTNMSTSWRDGLAFCAIIHNFRPDLIDFTALKKEDIYYNNELAFSIAEKHLGIPSLLDPADMLKYEVPDRFSILTYLSQYYRVFSNQEPTSKKVTEKEPKSTDGLDGKMANTTAFVGVPKREPCRKCGNPVFFAERISFEQKLYHRSCLKCARCGAQLTLGSFYETETDGEYCCETCPDEEIQIAERRRSMSSEVGATEAAVNGSRENVRTSRSSKLLERISFFESAPLSDEEKTSNMVRRAKMSSFLKDSLEKSDKLESDKEVDKIEPTPLEESSESEEEPELEEIPPSLPATEPPPSPPSVETPPIASDQITELVNESTIENVPNIVQSTVGLEDKLNGNKESNSTTIVCDSHESPESPEKSHEPPETSEELNNAIAIEPVTLNDDSVCKLNGEETTPREVEKIVVDAELSTKDSQNDAEDVEPEKEAVKEDQPMQVPEVNVISEEEIDTTVSNPEEVPKNEAIVISDNTTTEQTNAEVTPQSAEKHEEESIVQEQYPSDLNPFGDDSDEDKVRAPSKPVPPARKVSTNPFGSDDEDETQPVSMKPPRPPPPKIRPLVPANPFDEDGDDEPENEIIPVIVKPSPRRTPVPTPRKQHNHTDSISSMETSLMSSQFGGSNASLASSLDSASASMTVTRRKKSKAPDAPVAFTKTSTENLSPSQSTTPRKKRLAPAPPSSTPKSSELPSLSPNPTQRLIALDASLIGTDFDLNEPVTRAPSNDSVVYRRTIVPLKVDDDSLTLETTTSERQWEKMKDNKEAQNRNRQSQTSPTSSQNDSYNALISNKSQQGKWKRRKGPAPALPVPLPERKTIKMLPLKEIRQELDIIETQQQGLEKQGVILEQMIRERCEGVDPEMDITGIQTNSKEVEDLIMQLFELVNEKNELFRRQAELMYLRRQHRLEQEQADLEYEIRLLMAQPERNKTDSDKEKEEALIARLVEIVQMRNDVVDCLEMDRLREAEEDMSIKQSIEERAASQQKHCKKDSDTEKSATSGDSSTKLSKKEKKKLKEAKKLVKSKKIDSEKDADETESSTKEKKKKKKFFSDFLHPKSSNC